MAEYAVGGGKVDQEGFLKFLLHLHQTGYTRALNVTQRGAGANMSVDVNIDSSNLAGALFNTSANIPYYGFMDATKNVVISTADPTNPRNDIVVAYIDLSLITSSVTNNVGALKFKAVAGTPAGSPADPSGGTIQTSVGAGNPYISLARAVVGAGVTSISNANIADLRTPAAMVMPYISGGSSNTKGNLVPNVADDTFALLGAVQSFITGAKSFASGILNATRPKITTSIDDANGHKALNFGTNGAVTVGLGAQQIFPYDFVASGCVWSGDAYASTLNGSMTSGVVVINGNPITVAAVTAHAFAASKDTYVDVLDNGDGTGLVVYTAATNNAASSALAANSIRIAIIVSGATNIAAATSVNQGQETMVLPIASSIPYAVTDSLGNLICPRDNQRTTLGIRQSVTGQGSITTAVFVLGLSTTIIVPNNGRKIRIEAIVPKATSTSAAGFTLGLYNTATVTGSPIETSYTLMGVASSLGTECKLTYEYTPTPGTQAYCIGITCDAGTGNIAPSATLRASLRIKQV